MPYHREWKKLYDTRRWKRLRLQQLLQAEPLCAKCKKGLTVAAEVAHHLVPHKGDLTLFYTGKLESLCAHCHNVITGMDEQHGYSNDIGVDGWPIDSRHPVYAHRSH